MAKGTKGDKEQDTQSKQPAKSILIKLISQNLIYVCQNCKKNTHCSINYINEHCWFVHLTKCTFCWKHGNIYLHDGWQKLQPCKWGYKTLSIYLVKDSCRWLLVIFRHLAQCFNPGDDATYDYTAYPWFLDGIRTIAWMTSWSWKHVVYLSKLSEWEYLQYLYCEEPLSWFLKPCSTTPISRGLAPHREQLVYFSLPTLAFVPWWTCYVSCNTLI